MMRKLLALMATVALALGAQAGTMEYTYNLTLYDVPLTSMKNVESIKCYLVDSSVTSSKVLYGTKGSVLAEFEYVGMTPLGDAQVNNVQYKTKSYNLAGEIHSDTANKFALDLRRADGYIGQVTFESGKIEWNDMGKSYDDVKDYAKKNLKAYLVVTAKEEGESVNYEFPVEVTANGSNVALGSSATYQQVVPEPTSGMLVLLGFAGLVLRRKRAA